MSGLVLIVFRLIMMWILQEDFNNIFIKSCPSWKFLLRVVGKAIGASGGADYLKIDMACLYRYFIACIAGRFCLEMI